MAVALLGVLAGTAPVNASVDSDPGAGAVRYDFLGARGSPSGDSAACTAAQCGLIDQKSAAVALAVAAGARPANPLDHPSMVPYSVRANAAGASGGTLSAAGAKAGSDTEPVLFSVIAPSPVAHSQLCMEDGNLLGLAPTCKPPPTPNSVTGYNCPSGDRYDRFGMKIACRVGTDAPEPGTFVLLGIGLLGLAAVRIRSTRRKGSVAPL